MSERRMPTTQRVDWLLHNLGDLSDADLSEAKEIAMRNKPEGDYDRADGQRSYRFEIEGKYSHEHHQGELALDDTKPPIYRDDWVLPAAVEKQLTPEERRGPVKVMGLSCDEVKALTEENPRIATLEATVTDLYAKVKALETRLGVGKDP